MPRTIPARSLDEVYADISTELSKQKKQEILNEILKNGKESLTIEKITENL